MANLEEIKVLSSEHATGAHSKRMVFECDDCYKSYLSKKVVARQIEIVSEETLMQLGRISKMAWDQGQIDIFDEVESVIGRLEY